MRFPSSIMILKTAMVVTALCALSARAEWQPVKDKMTTEWGRRLRPESVWQEYPRPQLERADWTNLNGLWDYAITASGSSVPREWAGQILVPFCPESTLSGVGRLIEPQEALWYRRSIPGPKDGKRTLLNFEAVDYTTSVRVNGRMIGSHTGGYTPFSFDITPALKAEGNELLVRVDDATEGFQLHGKQKLKPGGIFYSRVSGIWQTVWLENPPNRYVAGLDFNCDIRSGTIRITPELSGPPTAGEIVRVTAYFGDKEVASNNGNGTIALSIPDAKLWSPSEPNLYNLKVEIVDGRGAIIDELKSYCALREFGKAKDANGNWRFTLNGKSIFHWGPLDQGWWPDGLLTAPSEAAMIFDIDYLKAAGFNMIRKHVKIEPRRYYAHCDKIGMLLWQDQVSTGYGPKTEPLGSSPTWSRMDPNPSDGDWPDAAHQQFITEYKRMVDHLRNFPCIAVWTPFNEAWGQHRTMEIGKMAVAYDKTRSINIASGGNFWPVGDIADAHQYPNPAFPIEEKRFADYVKVVGEFGGHGMPIKGHLWKENSSNWGYGGLPKNLDEWKDRYTRSIGMLASLRKHGICAGVYTQTTDVEGEVNGLLTYDRIPKVDAAWLRPFSKMLLNTPDVVKTTEVIPTSEKEAQVWHFTTDTPADGWQTMDFDDSAWATGKGGFGKVQEKNANVGTPWNTTNIWLRREVDVTRVPSGRAVLRVFHDEDAEVFLNGTKIVATEGFVRSYVDFPISDESLLKAGHNVIAIHCRQTVGGQFIDAGIMVEGAN